MKRFALTTALALLLAPAAFAADLPEPATTPEPPVAAVQIEDAAEEGVILGAGGIQFQSGPCWFCPVIHYDECSSTNWEFSPCSDPSLECSCRYCNGFLSCIR